MIINNRTFRPQLLLAVANGAVLMAAGVIGTLWLSGCGKNMIRADVQNGEDWITDLKPISETPDTLTDGRDGQKYRTVTIGSRTWMAQNLNYQTGGSWCYGNDDSNCGKYGRLYDWRTAIDACPVGWHLPSRQEWYKLVMTAGGPSAAGKKLKATSGWDNSGNGTDYYRFSIMPGGYRDTNGRFNGIGADGTYWANTECDCDYGGEAFVRYMDAGFDAAEDAVNDKRTGLSVRCVLSGSSIFRDHRDDKIYQKTTIGKQTWMAENLNYKTDNSWCYGNNGVYCVVYGRLYDWKAATGACPPGWHLPSRDEWDSLARAIGGEKSFRENKNVYWDNASDKLRSENGWDSRFSVDWKDEYGFSALPIGRRKSNGEYYPIYGDGTGEWWTASAINSDSAFTRNVNYYGDVMDENKISKLEGAPIRCVEDG